MARPAPLMPAHLKPRDQRVDNRPQRQGLVIVDDPGPPAEVQTWPAAPDGLLAETYRAWDRYWNSKIRKALQGEIELERLERWAYTLDEWYRVRRAIRRRRVMFTLQGPKLNPLVGYQRQLEAELARVEAAFGMTPLARARMGLTVAEGKRTAAELNRMLEGGGRRDHGPAPAASDRPADAGDDWSAGFEAG